jgi:uncharacterized protein YbbK (DUF523 family)
MSRRWAVSACLLGEPCRYDGAAKGHEGVQRWVEAARAAGVDVRAVCPEALGGLGTPRPAAELVGGTGADVWAGVARVRRVADGVDVTEAFVAGAVAADPGGLERAILKARSPSCGAGTTTREGQRVAGDGVFAAKLRAAGVALDTEETLGQRGARADQV